MRKGILFLMMAFVCQLGWTQTTIFNLPGGGSFPAGWSAVNNVSTNDIDRSSYYLLDAGNPSDIITTNNNDLSAYSTATLNVDIASFGSGTHHELKVEVSLDGGATYPQSYLTSITTGSYSTKTINIPSVSATTVIRFSNNGTSGRGIRMQDIMLEATAASLNDTDTEVYDPTTQVISANIASTATTTGTAVDVFRMTIEDQNSGDGLDTKVTNIRIKPHTSNTADWTDHIQGIVIDDGAAFLTPSSVTITDTEIDIIFPATELVVPDAGPATDVTVAIFLNTSNITDNTVFSCFVDGDDHGFTADATGSDFVSSFSLGDVVSNDFNIQVEATELQVQTQPSDVAQGNTMSPDFIVAYTDVNGNIDLDYDGLGNTTSVSTTGSFDGAATTTVAASSGIASFSNLVFSAQGVGLTLTATDISGLLGTSVVSNTFDVTAPAVMINQGDIVINEYMANPDCEGDSSGEFVELYNTTVNAIDIAGWTLEDDGSDSHTFTGANGTTSIPAAGYLILGIDGAGSASPDYDYSSFTLSNGDDEIVLKDGGTEICRVDYSNGDPFGAGVSVQLPENYDYSLADDGEILDSEFIEPNSTYGCGDFGTPGAANVLPINLLTFTATATENQTLVKWTTSAELNNDYMAVEHSTNGRDFTEIGRVKGAGTTEQAQNYTFTDTKPANGVNFYRLRQVDFDGHTTYHKIVSVMMYGKEGEIRLAPTEVQSQVMLYLPEVIDQSAEIRIYDMSGRLWQSSILEAGNSQKAFDLAHLAVGQYVLQVVGTQTVSTVRFNKL